MPVAGNQFYVMHIKSGMLLLQPVEFLGSISRESIPSESCVIGSGPEGEGNIGAVLRRGILQRLSPGHRTCTGKIVSIERRQPLRAIAALGDTEEIYPVWIYFP